MPSTKPRPLCSPLSHDLENVTNPLPPTAASRDWRDQRWKDDPSTPPPPGVTPEEWAEEIKFRHAIGPAFVEALNKGAMKED